jgi:hypothetical protein
LHPLAWESCLMDGRDDFHDIEPYVGEKARCGDSAKS